MPYAMPMQNALQKGRRAQTGLAPKLETEAAHVRLMLLGFWACEERSCCGSRSYMTAVRLRHTSTTTFSGLTACDRSRRFQAGATMRALEPAIARAQSASCASPQRHGTKLCRILGNGGMLSIFTSGRLYYAKGVHFWRIWDDGTPQPPF